ncbi:ketopantoate reductase family protein [Virgibacillus sp. L01]|uniref:ketopantoate reductase family protein n=1 Tax=Virgibacillus sp. L01 TaxID=3457429 RepID=UPI003FCF1386
MHIVVLGAGALGGYFGSRWEEAGADVTYLVRGKRAKQLEEQGLKVNSTQGNYVNRNPHVVTEVHDIENPDLVFVSVKGYHLTGTLESLKVLSDKGAFILPVLNGIEHINVLQDYLGEESVIGGLSFIVATLNDDGHVEHSSDFHKLVFGPLNSKQSDICQEFWDLSSKAKVETTYSDSILQELWKKYLFINAFSGITTAADLPIGPVRDNEETLKVAKMILNEMKQLANSYNIEITDEDVAGAKSNLQNFGYDSTSSMHQDRRKGQTLELDHLHGGALRLAEVKGLKMPFTEAVYGIIKPFEGV